ncbi:Probable 6-phosphogluconolactonase [Galdieria sulphuraria]|nr:Probable 6-phosphogluconolactonase [Galdieria sulphuraria]
MPESVHCGFLSCSFSFHSSVTRRSACSSFSTVANGFVNQQFRKIRPAKVHSKSFVHHLAMSITSTKTRYIESDFSVFRISQDVKEVEASFGDYFVEIASKAIEKQGSFTLAISGGSVLQCFSNAILETAVRRERVDWERTLIFLVDERYVPWDDPQSNYGQLHKVLQASGVEHKVKVFPVNTSLSLEEAASSYEQDILSFGKKVPAFDLILLGLGEDGHTASLFPNKELLDETKKLVGYETSSPKPPLERITLTLPTINHAKNVAFIVVGKGKAQIMQRLCEDHSLQYPARLVVPIFTRKEWFVDEDAMSQVVAAQEAPREML